MSARDRERATVLVITPEEIPLTIGGRWQEVARYPDSRSGAGAAQRSPALARLHSFVVLHRQ